MGSDGVDADDASGGLADSAIWASDAAGRGDAGMGRDGGSARDASDRDSGSSPTDAATRSDASAGLDASSADAGARDAGGTDAGPRDAGAHDAGPGDAGHPDAGHADAGPLGCTLSTVETFEAGSWPVAPWVTEGTGGTVETSSAHDGTYGLLDPGWHYDPGISVGRPGDRIRAWTRGSSGRFYLGFGASSSGARSFAAAWNSDDVRFQDNPGYAHVELTNTEHRLETARWYLLEVEFGSGGLVTGRLYDSDGVTVLATLTHDYGTSQVGGIAVRGFRGTSIDTIAICR